MSSLKGSKAVAAITLVAAAMSLASPAVASSKNSKSDPNCQITQRRPIEGRMLAPGRLHAHMERALESAEMRLRAIDREPRNVVHCAGSWRDTDLTSARRSHPITRGVGMVAALAKLRGQGLMVARKMLSTAAKLIPPVFGGAR